MKTILDLGTSEKQEKMPKPFCSPRWLLGCGSGKKRVHLAGLGDVGGTVLIGLTLLGGGTIGSLGIYDLNEHQCRRWEMELNQICPPYGRHNIPRAEIIGENQLFQCDIFAFCIAKSVPPVESGVGDVRMAQFDANQSIVAWYAKQAANAHFDGLFLVISDPVDLLCKAALLGSGDGAFPLHPGQIQGCGLGVMNARASYFARQQKTFADYLTEGRAFGPHGEGLVLANSMDPCRYDDALSRKLTDITIKANLKVRKEGFKPYIAPALSSAALTILAIIRGEWNYSSNYLSGVYFGARNRTTPNGTAWETHPLPEPLYERLAASHRYLEEIYECNNH